MYTVGKLDKEIYSCITDDISVDEVIITDKQIQHIKERHPNDYERFAEFRVRCALSDAQRTAGIFE